MSENADPITRPSTLPAVVAYAPGDHHPETADVPRAGPDDKGGGRPGDRL